MCFFRVLFRLQYIVGVFQIVLVVVVVIDMPAVLWILIGGRHTKVKLESRLKSTVE